jgi:glutamine transport system substrate-binding protein
MIIIIKGENVLKNAKIKGLLVLSFIVLILFSAACGNQDGATGDTDKTLLVGTDAAYAPFEYLDKGEIVGFDIDLLAAIMEEAGLNYEVNNLGWDPLFETVRGNNADLGISAITINEDRKKTFDFSRPYFESTNMILIPEGSDIKNAKDLEGKKVGVQNGTTGASAVEKLLGENHPDIAKYENNVLAIMALKSGEVDAVVADNTVVIEYVENNPNENFVALSDTENFEAELYGLMFPKGSELTGEINTALKTVIENGTYAEIYKKWFDATPDVDVLLNAE